jgi:nitroimidazol reductase NimA-like FMN-containing flavoprotein (pyridoxamine 5'-phosphate oxidase superfamily)
MLKEKNVLKAHPAERDASTLLGLTLYAAFERICSQAATPPGALRPFRLNSSRSILAPHASCMICNSPDLPWKYRIASMPAETYPISKRNKVKRMSKRAHYDAATIHDMLDSALFCHIAYVVDGQPYCTPTLFWRRGDNVIWHGSVGSRMLREQVKQIDVCLTVTFLDGLVLTRSAFLHAVNYRSAMIFGRASLIEDPEEKEREVRELVNTFLPGRIERTVPPTETDIRQTSFLKMPIEEASAKIRAYPASGEDESYRPTPVWAGDIPIEMRVGAPVPCSFLAPGIEPGRELNHYKEGARLDEVLLKIRREAYPEKTR